jgi:hypothetical protein
MSLSTNQSRGTADPVDVEYLHHEPDGGAPGIHMHLDAMDGIARDVMEGFKALPRRGVEVGGLLLGKVIGSEHPDVWIERYQRIECRHRFGPQFVLDEADHAALEEAAERIAASTELAVVGLYRSHTRSGFQLEESDLELVGRYFSDPSDLVLLIRPENMIDIEAQFFARDADGAMQPLGEPFPFRGRTLGPADFMLVEEDDTEEPAEATRQTKSGVQGLPGRETGEAADSKADVADSIAAGGKADIKAESGAGDAPAADPAAAETASPAGSPSEREVVSGPPRERMRRLVPDFAPAAEPVEPGGVFSFEPRLAPPPPPQFTIEETEPSRLRAVMAKWWPLAGAVILVCAAIWVLLGQSHRGPVSSSGGAGETASPQEYRPVGMYVDPGPQRWRISWNSSATAFQNARNVALFVRDGEAEDRVDLTKQDVDAGAYTWQPKGTDVTFRLEAIDAAGRISAESFRVIRQSSGAATSAAAVPAASGPASSLPARAPAANEPAAHLIPAKATHKVPPVVPASIRPRISGVIPVDVRVRINAHGRVTSATPTIKPRPGLSAYLTSRAVYAARLWRFTPARENGRPTASTQTIHFVFEK